MGSCLTCEALTEPITVTWSGRVRQPTWAAGYLAATVVSPFLGGEGRAPHDPRLVPAMPTTTPGVRA